MPQVLGLFRAPKRGLLIEAMPEVAAQTHCGQIAELRPGLPEEIQGQAPDALSHCHVRNHPPGAAVSKSSPIDI
jgi:hypothetical protein